MFKGCVVNIGHTPLLKRIYKRSDSVPLIIVMIYNTQHFILILLYGVPFVSKLDEIEVFTNVRGYLQMSVDIYKCQWVFINVNGYL